MLPDTTTTANNTVNPSLNNNRRRPYSRLGCRECKRRKIKCTEEKPSCSICVRLDKVCSYPLPGEKVLRISRRLIKDEIDSLAKSTQLLPVQYDLPKMMKSNESTIKQHSEKSSIVRLLQNTTDITLPSQSTTPTFTSGSETTINGSRSRDNHVVPTTGNSLSNVGVFSMSMTNVTFVDQPFTGSLPCTPAILNNGTYQFSGTDLTGLTTDLNNLVSEIIGISSQVTARPTNESSHYLHIGITELQGNSFHETEYVRNIPIDFLQFERQHERLYFEQFYNNFASIILAFGAYDPDTRTVANPARDIILKAASTEPFVLAAILAEGAKICHDKTNLPEDARAYQIYLSNCLKLLDRAKDINVNGNVLNANIEAMLITLLVLTASTAISMQKWRPHLNGAKELLLRLSKRSGNYKISKTIVFCKFWFISIEILAGLSTEPGGTLQEDWELDAIISPGDSYEIEVLRELGLLTDTGFNVIMGFLHLLLTDFRDLLKLLNKYKQQKIKNDEMNHLRTLTNFYQQTNISYVNPKGIINDDELKLCKYQVGLPIEEIRIREQRYWVSWQDVSHQAYVVSSILVILFRFFDVPQDNANVQFYVQRLLSFIGYLDNFSDALEHGSPYLLLLIQWPMVVAGLYCKESNQRALLMKYFQMVSQVGSASASRVMDVLSKRWARNKPNVGNQPENTDTIIY